MTNQDATRLVADLVFETMKARSTMKEGIGDDKVGEAICEDLYPDLFGELLPRLVAYQDATRRQGVINGTDLYNWMTWIRLKSPIVLATHPFPEPNLEWVGQTWRIA